MMTNNNTMNTMVIKAAREAGIRTDELFAVEIVGIENGICEMVLTTAWNIVECFVDMDTEEVLGIMTTAKTMAEILRAA